MISIKNPTEQTQSTKRISLLLIAILIVSMWSVNFDAALIQFDWRSSVSNEKGAGSKFDDKLKANSLRKIKHFVPP